MTIRCAMGLAALLSALMLVGCGGGGDTARPHPSDQNEERQTTVAALQAAQSRITLLSAEYATLDQQADDEEIEDRLAELEETIAALLDRVEMLEKKLGILRPPVQDPDDTTPLPDPATSDEIKAHLGGMIRSSDTVTSNLATVIDGNNLLPYARAKPVGLVWSDLTREAELDYSRLPTRRDISLARGERSSAVGRTNFSGMGYAGWMAHNFFLVAGSAIEDTNPLDPRLTTFHHAYSIGDTTGRNPVSGSASWAGVMAGYTGDGKTIAGDADLTADFAASNLDLEFTNMREHGGTARTPDMRWDNVPMRGGSFEAPGLHGHFYGTNHAEAGGIFNRNRITGAFGAKREVGPEPPPPFLPESIGRIGSVTETGTEEYDESSFVEPFGSFEGTRPTWSYSGWGLWGSVDGSRLFTATISGINTPGGGSHQYIDVYSPSVTGTLSFDNPTGYGTATWTGKVRAYERHPQTFGTPVEGDAHLSIDFDEYSPSVGVDFTNFERNHPDMSWDRLTMTRGRFRSSYPGDLEGKFYGDRHEGVAGTFERDGLKGVFGALREPD